VKPLSHGSEHVSESKAAVTYTPPTVPVPEPVKLNVEFIKIPKGYRTIDKGAIRGLMDSIRSVGLQNPITVRRLSDHKCLLVAGGHRLTAFKKLGLTRIPARIVDKATARIWHISENLHRVELTRLERDEAIVQYAKARKRQDGQVAHPLRGGKQPNDKGNSQIARELGLDRKQIRQAKANAGICTEAKALLKSNGLDNNAQALTSVAKCKEVRGQIDRVKALARKRASSNTNDKERKPGRDSDVAIDLAFRDLKKRWQKLKFRRRFEGAAASARRRFIDEVWQKMK
jgi:hypothetical protein